MIKRIFTLTKIKACVMVSLLFLISIDTIFFPIEHPFYDTLGRVRDSYYGTEEYVLISLLLLFYVYFIISILHSCLKESGSKYFLILFALNVVLLAFMFQVAIFLITPATGFGNYGLIDIMSNDLHSFLAILFLPISIVNLLVLFFSKSSRFTVIQQS